MLSVISSEQDLTRSSVDRLFQVLTPTNGLKIDNYKTLLQVFENKRL